MLCVVCRHLSSSALQHGAPWFWQSYHISVTMLTLASKLKKEDGGKTGRASGASDSTHRVSIRDRLLTKGTRVFYNLVHFSVSVSLFYYRNKTRFQQGCNSFPLVNIIHPSFLPPFLLNCFSTLAWRSGWSLSQHLCSLVRVRVTCMLALSLWLWPQRQNIHCAERHEY